MEVDEPWQRGASDWSCSQGRLGDLSGGQLVFAKEGADHVGEAFEQHHTAWGGCQLYMA